MFKMIAASIQPSDVRVHNSDNIQYGTGDSDCRQHLAKPSSERMTMSQYRPHPETRARAKAMADETHNRIAQMVGVEGAPFSRTYSNEVAASAGAWRHALHVDDETYHCAVQYASDSVTLRAKIEELRSKHSKRWAFWR
jgi:hypothetical protein